MDPREVGKASAIAGGMCGLAALFIAPQLFWVGWIAGTAAGLVSGYVSYNFGRVLWAIPIVWERTKIACGITGKVLRKVAAFFRKPHPIGYGAVAGGVVLELLFAGFLIVVVVVLDYFLTGAPTPPPQPRPILAPLPIGLLVVLGGMMQVIFTALSVVLLGTLAQYGARSERCYFSRLEILTPTTDELERWRQEGYRELPFTYRTVYHMVWVGFRRTAWNVFAFFVWRAWVRLWRGACWLGQFARRFGWELFRLIHCQGRVTSALYGTAGGMVALFVGYPHAITVPERTLLVAFCALLGFAFGRGVACELVAKRWLGLPVHS